MPGSVYGTEDTKVNSQGKPGAYHHKDHIPGGGEGEEPVKKQVISWINIFWL